MKILIDIPQEMFKATQTYYSDNTTRLSMKSCIEKIANGTPIPDNATNGDVIKAMFPNAWRSNYIDSDNKCTLYIDDYELEVDIDWWNAPYKGVEE